MARSYLELVLSISYPLTLVGINKKRRRKESSSFYSVRPSSNYSWFESIFSFIEFICMEIINIVYTTNSYVSMCIYCKHLYKRGKLIKTPTGIPLVGLQKQWRQRRQHGDQRDLDLCINAEAHCANNVVSRQTVFCSEMQNCSNSAIDTVTKKCSDWSGIWFSIEWWRSLLTPLHCRPSSFNTSMQRIPFRDVSLASCALLLALCLNFSSFLHICCLQISPSFHFLTGSLPPLVLIVQLRGGGTATV